MLYNRPYKYFRGNDMAVLFSSGEFTRLKNLLVLYDCALKSISTRMDILLEDFKHIQQNNPIEHIKSRLKSPESIAEKLHRLGLEVTAENARYCLYDIAGIRVICAYTTDIPLLANIFKRQPDLTVLIEKDYITIPKASGYRSYHIIFDVPIILSQETLRMPVEVQIRTQAMDFWASLEHKVRYKFKGNAYVPKHISDELRICADKIAELDTRMHQINEISR